MLKRIIFAFSIIAVMASSAIVCTAQKIGAVIDSVYHTDIVAYINNYAIPSYAAKGTSVIVAEDLRNFGFDVVWDGSARTLTIIRNAMTDVVGMNVEKNGNPGTKMSDILYTDIKVYAGGLQIPSYAINGYTMIPIESLTMLGICNWVPEQRAIKLWVDGLNIRSEMQSVNQYIGDLTGVWEKEIWWKGAKYPDYFGVAIYSQQGNKISMYIESVQKQGMRIRNALVEDVNVVNNTAVFKFTDSGGSRATGTMVFSGDTMMVTYADVVQVDYSIIDGNGLMHKKIDNKENRDFILGFNPEFYR